MTFKNELIKTTADANNKRNKMPAHVIEDIWAGGIWSHVKFRCEQNAKQGKAYCDIDFTPDYKDSTYSYDEKIVSQGYVTTRGMYPESSSKEREESIRRFGGVNYREDDPWSICYGEMPKNKVKRDPLGDIIKNTGYDLHYLKNVVEQRIQNAGFDNYNVEWICIPSNWDRMEKGRGFFGGSKMIHHEAYVCRLNVTIKW